MSFEDQIKLAMILFPRTKIHTTQEGKRSNIDNVETSFQPQACHLRNWKGESEMFEEQTQLS